MSSPESWTLIDYFAALWRYKWRALAVCLVAIGAGVAFIVYMPKKYESEAKLFVRIGRENATLDPTVIKGDQIAVASSQSRETEINSIVEHLKSRGILQKAMDKVYPADGSESDIERERAYAKLKSRIQISSPVNRRSSRSPPRVIHQKKLSRSPPRLWRSIWTNTCASADLTVRSRF